jgi:hypothetical protein
LVFTTAKPTPAPTTTKQPTPQPTQSPTQHKSPSPTPPPTAPADTYFCTDDWFFDYFVGEINIVFEAADGATGLLTAAGESTAPVSPSSPGDCVCYCVSCFPAAALKGMCTVDEKVRGFHSFDGYYYGGHYCRSKSVGSYMAKLAGQDSCDDITDDDIDDIVLTLQKCAAWFDSLCVAPLSLSLSLSLSHC